MENKKVKQNVNTNESNQDWEKYGAFLETAVSEEDIEIHNEEDGSVKNVVNLPHCKFTIEK